jgi:Putative auto-transporter adhesin, head GIN domain
MRGAILMTTLLLGACSMGEASEGQRQMGSRDFQVGAFDKVALSGPPNVVVTVGGAPSVRAEGDTELLEKLEIEVVEGTLRIGYKKGRWSFGWGKDRVPVTIRVSAPSLTGAKVAGSGEMKIDKVEGGDLAGEIAGSGEIELASLRARNARFAIAGSGGVSAAGTAESADFSISGSGEVRAGGLEVKRATVSIAGSGNIEAKATETADISIAGSGDVAIAGPARCNVKKSGSGNVRCSG